jgi:cation diffusion facilitator CzcD-associated flavoprotein CzcO
VVVIGSGATAVTIVPELAVEAAGYYATTINPYCCLPNKDKIALV